MLAPEKNTSQKEIPIFKDAIYKNLKKTNVLKNNTSTDPQNESLNSSG